METCIISVPFMGICIGKNDLLIAAAIIIVAVILFAWLNTLTTTRHINDFDKKRERVRKERSKNK